MTTKLEALLAKHPRPWVYDDCGDYIYDANKSPVLDLDGDERIFGFVEAINSLDLNAIKAEAVREFAGRLIEDVKEIFTSEPLQDLVREFVKFHISEMLEEKDNAN